MAVFETYGLEDVKGPTTIPKIESLIPMIFVINSTDLFLLKFQVSTLLQTLPDLCLALSL